MKKKMIWGISAFVVCLAFIICLAYATGSRRTDTEAAREGIAVIDGTKKDEAEENNGQTADSMESSQGDNEISFHGSEAVSYTHLE